MLIMLLSTLVEFQNYLPIILYISSDITISPIFIDVIFILKNIPIKKYYAIYYIIPVCNQHPQIKV